MWNENIEFYATLARPKAGVRFDIGNEFADDLEEAVKEANRDWNGERMFEVIHYEGISVKMAYRALDPIKGDRTLTRFLQKISQILAYDKNWNDRVTRKEGTIFTVDIINNSNIKNNNTEARIDDIIDNEPTAIEILKQILEVVTDMRDEMRK